MIPALLLLALAAPIRSFSDERHLLDRRLETLRRILPDGPSLKADVAHVREAAENAGLSGVDVLARPPLEAGDVGRVVLDVTALGLYVELDRFFRQLALSHRLVDVESLTLTATPDERVRLACVVQLPYRPAGATLPAPPEGLREQVRQVPRPTAEAFLRDQALAYAKSETIVRLRRAQRNPRLFLSELAAASSGRPVVLLYAHFADEFLLRGITVGEGPARALESRLERGFFRVAEYLMARDGACHRFEARGTSPVAGLEAALPIPAEDPFRPDEAPCLVDRDPPGAARTLRAPGGKKPGRGPLTVRLRDVDLADAFLVLHLLTEQGFVVDDNVRGRVSLELTSVTLEEALAELRKLELQVSEAGAIRRVSAAAPGTPGGYPAPGGGVRASLALKRSALRELLAVMTEADPQLAALGPQGSLGRVSLWVKDLPIADVRHAALKAVGLEERIEEDQRLLSWASGLDGAALPVAAAAPERRLVLRPADLTAQEFELAGLATAGEGWRAFAYTPSGTLLSYQPGDPLFDAVVRGVSATDVLLETEAGSLRVPIGPPR